MIHVRLLGAPQIERDGVPVGGLRSRKALALLGYLAADGRPVSRAHLADLLWGGLDEARGRANLSWVVHQITTVVPGSLTAERHSVACRRQPSCWLDIDALLSLQAEGGRDALAAAVALYRGPFLDGIQLHDCPEFEIWLAGERERWAQILATLLHTLVQEYTHSGEYERALHFSRQLLTLEPWRETAHRETMELLVRAGRWSSALAQFASCRRILAEELGVEPTEETRVLYERIKLARKRPRHNLPPQPTPFIGRLGDTAEVLRLIDNPDCRLLTLWGPGGIGKTRLALKTAAARTSAFLEGVWFVPLASVSSAGFLVATIANALGASLSGPKNAQDQLLDYLRGKQLLLILDGFEHLLAASHLPLEILKEAPAVKLLITSRASLNLRWEWRYEVGGLAYPLSTACNERDLQEYDALILFHEMARRLNPHYRPTPSNSQAVARICRLVEGMPLAIELATASIRTHSPEEIAQEVESNLEFLGASLEDVPLRHRSLRAVFDHSWTLLKPHERQALMKLTTFHCGFWRTAAHQVAHASPAMLECLADKSLLRVLPSGRCEMHPLLRRYASDLLTAAPHLERASRKRHAAHYLALLRELENRPQHRETTRTLTMIKADLPNVRAAWAWAVTESNLEEIERTLPSLSRFYILTGPYQEAETLITIALDHLQAAESPAGEATRPDRSSPALVTVLANLFAEHARFLNRQGRYDAAIDAARNAIRLSESAELPDRSAAAEASGYLQWGRALVRKGAYKSAETYLGRALRLSSGPTLQRIRAASLRSLGNAHHGTGHYISAVQFYKRALSLSQTLGDRQSEGALLANLGLAAHHQGVYCDARTYYEDALQVAREIGDRGSESLALINLGYVFDQQGAYAHAQPLYRKCLHIAREIGDRQGESIALACLGLLFHHLGDDQPATKFSRQAASIAREIGDRRVEGYALTRLAHALLGLGRVQAAEDAYRRAILVRRQLGERSRLIESQAGLARTQLARGSLAEAQDLVEEILHGLEATPLNDTDEPFRIYLTCYQVLRACGDSRARPLLEYAYCMLQSRAAELRDDNLQRSFLWEVAAHREISEEYRAAQQLGR